MISPNALQLFFGHIPVIMEYNYTTLRNKTDAARTKIMELPKV